MGTIEHRVFGIGDASGGPVRLDDSLRDVMVEVRRERERQDAKWGTIDQRAEGAGMWLAMLVEEVGEVARGLCEIHNDDSVHGSTPSTVLDHLEAELVQVAAVAVAWVQSIRHVRQKQSTEKA